MKISELLRGLADIIDQENQGPTMAVQITAPSMFPGSQWRGE